MKKILFLITLFFFAHLDLCAQNKTIFIDDSNKNSVEFGIGLWIPKKDGFGKNHKSPQLMLGLTYERNILSNDFMHVGALASFYYSRHKLKDHLDNNATNLMQFLVGGRVYSGDKIIPFGNVFLQLGLGISHEKEKGDLETHGRPNKKFTLVLTPGYMLPLNEKISYGFKMDFSFFSDDITIVNTSNNSNFNFVWLVASLNARMSF